MNMHSLLQIGYLLQVTPGRLFSIVAGLLGIMSVVIGWRALARSAKQTGSRRFRAIMALVVGLIGVFLSGLHLATTTGGFGTGKGRAGAIVALVIGSIGTSLGWRALKRSRQIATGATASKIG
jgi:apolipoprotein N-acyltransferase